MKFKYVCHYFYDPVMCSEIFDQQLDYVSQGLPCLRDSEFEPYMVVLAVQEVSFLGHCVLSLGVSVDSGHMQALRLPSAKRCESDHSFVGDDKLLS
jgi:hypothetical protein